MNTELIKDIQLQRMDTTSTPATTGQPFSASDLWKEQPAIVFVVRRPGCPLCREHALDLSSKHPDFAAKGVKLAAVVHEKLGVEEFSGFFKNGEIYFDEEKAFFNGESASTSQLLCKILALFVEVVFYPASFANSRGRVNAGVLNTFASPRGGILCSQNVSALQCS